MIALLVDFSIAHAKCSSGHCISVLCHAFSTDSSSNSLKIQYILFDTVSEC